MLVEDRGVPALEPQAAPRAASLLLHCLAVALLVCIAAGATLYLYWAFNDVVSSHRRHMNAAAYDAQQFFDQREALLRSLSASAVRNVGSAHLDEALAHTGAAPQVEVLPLQEADGAYDWALVLTRRDLHRVALARTKVVYSSPRQASTLRSRPAASASRTLKSGSKAMPRPRWAKHRRVSMLLQIMETGGRHSLPSGMGSSGHTSTLPVAG